MSEYTYIASFVVSSEYKTEEDADSFDVIFPLDEELAIVEYSLMGNYIDLGMEEVALEIDADCNNFFAHYKNDILEIAKNKLAAQPKNHVRHGAVDVFAIVTVEYYQVGYEYNEMDCNVYIESILDLDELFSLITKNEKENK